MAWMRQYPLLPQISAINCFTLIDFCFGHQKTNLLVWKMKPGGSVYNLCGSGYVRQVTFYDYFFFHICFHCQSNRSLSGPETSEAGSLPPPVGWYLLRTSWAHVYVNLEPRCGNMSILLLYYSGKGRGKLFSHNQRDTLATYWEE